MSHVTGTITNHGLIVVKGPYDVWVIAFCGGVLNHAYWAPGILAGGAVERNFNQKDDSTVFRQLPSFMPIPSEKIGLYGDEYCKAETANGL